MAIPLSAKAARNRQDSGPVIVEILNSEESVVFWPQLNVNPFALFKQAVKLIASVKDPNDTGHSGVFASLDRGKLNMTLFEPNGFAEALITPWLMLHQWMAKAKQVQAGSFFRVLCPPQVNSAVSGHFANVTEERLACCDPYAGMVSSSAMVTSEPSKWKQEVDMLCGAEDAMGFTDKWIRRTALPILAAWTSYESQGGTPRERAEAAMLAVEKCESRDWKFACDQWLVKRLDE